MVVDHIGWVTLTGPSEAGVEVYKHINFDLEINQTANYFTNSIV